VTATVPKLESIDIASHEQYEQGIPHEKFALLRAHDPVHWHPWDWDGGGFWALTTLEDVVRVSRDPVTFSSARGHIYLWDLEQDALEARRSLLETDPRTTS
jgi:cytochrome P450